jgi:hypothetical protein
VRLRDAVDVDRDDDVTAHLSSDEALVLFEVLHRWEDAAIGGALEPGEQTALWALSAALESLLVEPFDEHYDVLRNEARARLAARGGA